jgi:hypothetical protein
LLSVAALFLLNKLLFGCLALLELAHHLLRLLPIRVQVELHGLIELLFVVQIAFSADPA